MKGLPELMLPPAIQLPGERDAEPDGLTEDVLRWEWEGGALAASSVEDERASWVGSRR